MNFMGMKEDVESLDAKIARLKIEYEQYFLGVLKREPLKLRDEIERLILRNSNIPITSTALKFRFSSLVSRYNSYKHYWIRMLRALEEGSLARKAEAIEGAPGAPGSKPLSKEPDLMQTGDETEDRAGVTPAPGYKDRESVLTKEPPPPQAPEKSIEEEPLKNIYNDYISAREKCKEPIKGLSFEHFRKTIDAEKKRLSAAGKANEVDVKVFVKDGKTKLQLLPKKG